MRGEPAKLCLACSVPEPVSLPALTCALAYCRYKDKAALVDVHQKSAAYARFKAAVSAAGVEFKDKVGQSYFETDLGYM